MWTFGLLRALMHAAEPSVQRALSEHPDSEKLQDILSSQQRQLQRPPGFAPDEAPALSRRKNRLQRELVVLQPGSLPHVITACART